MIRLVLIVDDLICLDFHVHVILVVLNIPILSFVCELDRVPSYYIDSSLDLTQLSAYFRSMVRDVQLISCTARKSMFKAY